MIDWRHDYPGEYGACLNCGVIGRLAVYFFAADDQGVRYGRTLCPDCTPAVEMSLADWFDWIEFFGFDDWGSPAA